MKKILLLTLFIFNFSFSQEVEKITYKFLNPEIVSNIKTYEYLYHYLATVKYWWARGALAHFPP